MTTSPFDGQFTFRRWDKESNDPPEIEHVENDIQTYADGLIEFRFQVDGKPHMINVRLGDIALAFHWSS